jgi:hypothetical protein
VLQSCSTARSIAVAPRASVTPPSAPRSSSMRADSAASASAAQCSGVLRCVESNTAMAAPLQTQRRAGRECGPTQPTLGIYGHDYSRQMGFTVMTTADKRN